MKKLIPLADIEIPGPQPDEAYRRECFDHEYVFHCLKRLLGAADYSKAGDRNAGLSAASETDREAARAILSGLT